MEMRSDTLAADFIRLERVEARPSVQSGDHFLTQSAQDPNAFRRVGKASGLSTLMPATGKCIPRITEAHHLPPRDPPQAMARNAGLVEAFDHLC